MIPNLALLEAPQVFIKGCRHDNLRWHQWLQIWYHLDSAFLCSLACGSVRQTKFHCFCTGYWSLLCYFHPTCQMTSLTTHLPSQCRNNARSVVCVSPCCVSSHPYMVHVQMIGNDITVCRDASPPYHQHNMCSIPHTSEHIIYRSTRHTTPGIV